MYLKQSTAAQVIELGPFVDDTDFKTAKTALTIANTDIKLRKHGGTTHANKTSGGATHIANGYYHATLDATDTDTVGQLDVHVNATGALAVWVRFWVLEEAIFDALFAASAAAFDASQRVDVGKWLGTAAATPTVAGVPKVDVTHFNGVAGTFAAGRPEVNTSHAAGTAWGSGAITAAAIAADAITAAKIADGAIDRATFAADTGLQSIRSNTAQAGAAGTVTLDASASATTDFYVGAWIFLTGGTGVGQARVCTAYNGTTKVATIAPNWATNPDATSTFAVLAAAQLTGVQGNVTGSVASVTGAVGSVTGAVGSVTGAVGSVTAAVTVGTNNDKTGYSIGAGGIGATAFAAGAIDAAAIAADAIGASELATDAVNEIRDAVFARAFSAAYGSHTFDELVKMIAATLLAKCSGMATTTGTFRNLADTGDVIVATIDANGNRTAVTRTP